MRAVARALTQSVDGALDLSRTTDLHASQRVGHCHAEVVVAVHRPDRLVAVGNALAQGADEFAVQLGHCISHRVRHVDGGRAFLDDCLQNAAEKIHLASVPVFRTELDVTHQVACVAHGLHRLLQHLVGRHAQLFLHVQR
jgi:hypothetical protein